MSPETQWAMGRNRRCETLINRPGDGLLVYGDDNELSPYGEDDVEEGESMGLFFQ